MKKPIIICVDDEKMVLTSLKSQLRRFLGTEYGIETIDSGDEAIEVFNELNDEGHEVPLVISDQIMPGKKGHELLAEINDINHDVKKILLTGQASAEAVGQAVNQAGLFRYISKPWDIDDLNITVKQAIESYFNEKKLKESEDQRKELLSELKSINESLEEKIKDRTKELEHQNKIIEQKNLDITSSLSYAKLIQESVLPKEKDIHRLFENSFVLYKPKDIVSGDFFWINYNDKIDKLYIAVADSTGHGVPGAFMSLIGSSLFNEAVRTSEFIKPNEIFSHVRNGIIKTLKQSQNTQKDGIDAAMISFNKNKNSLYYSGANIPLYLIRNGSNPLLDLEQNITIEPNLIEHNTHLYEIKGDNSPLAFHTGQDIQFQIHKIQMQEGDEVYLSSDGFADQFGGEKNKKFLRKRYKELLMSIFGKSKDKQKSVITETFNSWKGKYEQVDDICVLGFRI